MMSWLVGASLRQRVLVVALAAVLAVVGIRTLPRVAWDVFPDSPRPSSRSRPKLPASRPTEVESLVTVPIENALHGTSWLKTMRSKSVLGLSSVVLIFEEGTRPPGGPPARPGAPRHGGGSAPRGGPAPGDALAAVVH